MKRLCFRLLRILAIAYGMVFLLVAGCQRSMLYFPEKFTETAALARAGRMGLAPWKDAYGAIIGWHLPNPHAKNRLVVFHGNAGCALDRSYYSEAFQSLEGGADWEVFLFEYPGYGARVGSPGKSSFLTKGREAVDELLAADSRPLFLLGESIGSGVASALTGELADRVAGTILMIPFARLVEVANAKFPFLPVSLLLRDKFDNVAALSAYHGPVAFVVAERDEIIGPDQGRKLHAAYAGPKLLILMPGAGHNDFPTQPGADWVREAASFVLRPPPPARS